MDSKLRFSVVACLVPLVLSAIGAVRAADTTQASDEAPTAQCATNLFLPAGDSEYLFGAAVAVSGQTALVGIPGFSTAFVTPPVPPPYIDGRVAVFTCEASTQTWTRTASIQLPATEANQGIPFGVSTALQGDLAAIGAQYGVYLYKRRSQNWKQIATIIPDNSHAGADGTPFEQWGSVIALNDHVLAIAVTEISSTSSQVPNSFYVDVYQLAILGDRGAAIRIARLKPPAGDTGHFGASLALKGDTLVVGDPPDTTAYVYKRHGFTFTREQTLTGAEATTSSGFGSAVALSKDVILIGAPAEDLVLSGFGVASSGAVYAFRHESGPESPWVETQRFSAAWTGGPYAEFGGSLVVNRNGQAVIGTPSPYDDESQTEYGPTFFYTVQGGQFVLLTPAPLLLPGALPATSMGITDEYLITGFVANAGAGGSFSGAGIVNLNALPMN
jgi:hypothetical protein